MSDKTLLTAEDVRKRYGCGRDAALVVMRECGFRVGQKWLVRIEKLERRELGEALQQPKPMPAGEYEDHSSRLLSA